MQSIHLRLLLFCSLFIALFVLNPISVQGLATKPTPVPLTAANRVPISDKGAIASVDVSAEIIVREDDAANAEVGGPSSSWWHAYASGSTGVSNGHALWTYVSPFTNYVNWRPPLDACGNWEVYAFIPIIDTGRADSSNAQYVIHYRGGSRTVALDQNAAQKGWRSLGTYLFSQNAGNNGEYVQLGDYTGESTNSRTILFDDMAWVYRGDSAACYAAQFVGQSYGGTMQAGSTQTVGLELRNVGGSTWDSNTFLTARNPASDPNYQDDAHPLCDASTWVGGCNRIMNGAGIAPGQSKVFTFKVQAPSTPGTYRINFGMVQEGFTWFGAPLNGGIWFEFTVTNADPPLSCASFVAQQAANNLQVDMQAAAAVPQVWSFADDFSSDTGWPTWSDATSEVQIQNGRFCFDVHKSGTLVWDIHNTVSADNFTMRVELMPQTTSAEEYAYGIALRVSNRGYGFALSNWGRYEIVNFPADGTPKFREWTTHSAIRSAGTNVVEVTANQNQLTFYVNGTLIETILDSNFSNGKIGFYAATMGGGTQALFLADNLSLTTIDPDEPPTYTPTVTPTSVDIDTKTPTPTSTSTSTPQPNPITVTPTTSRTATATYSPTASRTATATPTNTFTPSPTATKTVTPPIPNVESKTILLVHGWQGLSLKGTTCADIPEHYNVAPPAPTQTDKPLGNDLPQWFANIHDYGYSPGYNFDVWIAYLDSSLTSTPSLNKNAECLRKQIKKIYEATKGKKITIIAHSMGGLVARNCLLQPGCPDMVNAIYTLGSPHGGINTIDSIAKLWVAYDPITGLIGAASFCMLQSGACEMTYSNMEAFNSINPNHSGIKYVFIGGDHSPVLSTGIFERLWSKHDGLVASQSAIGRGWEINWFHPLGEWKYIPAEWPLNSLPTTYWTDEVHTGQFEGHTYYDNRDGSPSDSFYCIAHEMWSAPLDSDKCRQVTDAVLAQSASANLDSMTLLQSTVNITGVLTADQVATHSLMLDSTGKSSFVLLANANEIDFTLIRPDGQVITPELAIEAIHSIAFNKTLQSAEFPASASYMISDTMPGTWQVQVKYLSPQTDAVRYVVYALLESDRQLIVGEPKTSYGVGATTVFTAALRNASGVGISGAQLSARVSRPDGKIDVVNYSDWGGGNYRAAYIVPNAPGYAMMDVDATGSDNGVDFTRHTNSLWAINPNSASFTGKVSDAPVDRDRDGLYDKLVVNVEIKVTQPATYTVIAQLLVGDKLVDSSSSGLAALDVGTHTIELLFDGFDIHNIDRDVALVVGNAQILDVTHGDISVAEEPTLHTTGVYQSDQFASDENSRIYLPVVQR